MAGYQTSIAEPTRITPFNTPTVTAATAAAPVVAAAPVATAPIPMPKPTVKPTTGIPLGSKPVTGSQPLIPPTYNPLSPPTTQPPAPTNSASVITGTRPTGGNAPVGTGTPFPAQTQPPVQAYPAGMDAGSIVSDFMTGLLDENGQYIQNARRRGLETAQNRGLLNSSISAGASQRAALESAQPLVNQMVGIQQDRENRAFTGEQNQLDRNQQVTMSQVQNWLNNETFNREFNGAISMLPITSAANLMSTIQQYALENPEVYTPDVINGFANFFQNNFATMLQDYFPQYYGGS